MLKNDLLQFQFAHFGDDSKPEKWFVTPESAIDFEPEYEDLLGYYEDGVKRTLTDEQIEVFRRTEMWHLERKELQLAEEAAEKAAEGPLEAVEVARGGKVRTLEEDLASGARSPVSDTSSLEDELMTRAAREKMQQPTRVPPREPARSSRSETPISVSSDNNKRRRPREVPYDERRKRQWESYIEENDPEQGSLTHRRMARELDNQQEESIEMDY